jgi:hypothetical protein
MDWFTFGVWAVSTGLYWLTYKKPKKPKSAKVEAPTTRDGSAIPIIWGTVAVSPANVKFEYLSKTNSTSKFVVQDIICLGYIDKFLGMFVGDTWVPYGISGYVVFPNSYPPVVYDYEGANQPMKFGTFEHPEKFQEFDIRSTYEDVIASSDDPNYTYRKIFLSNNPVNNTTGKGYLGMGRAGVDTLPYTDVVKDALFPSDQYTNRDNTPRWDYLTMATYYIMGCIGSVSARAYKVQRVVQYMDGTPAPSWGRVYRYTPIISTLHRPNDVIPLINLYNVCHSQTSANPFFIIHEVLTSPLLSMKIPTSKIDNVSLHQCGEKLSSENFGMNIALNSPEEANIDFIKEILDYVEGFMYLDRDIESPTFGKIKFKLARMDYDPNTIPVIDENIFTDVTDYTNEIDSENVINSVVVSYTDRFVRKQKYTWFGANIYFGFDSEKTIMVKNDEDIARRGLFEESISRPWVSDPLVATEIGRRYLYLNSAKPSRVRVSGHQELNGFNIGDVFKLVHPRMGFTGVIMRIFDKTVDSLESGLISLSCIEDYHGSEYSVYEPIVPDEGIPKIANTRYYEPTIWEVMISEQDLLLSIPSGVVPYRFIPEKTGISQLVYNVYKKAPSDSDYSMDESRLNAVFTEPPYYELDFTVSGTDEVSIGSSYLNILDIGTVLLIGSEYLKVYPASGNDFSKCLKRACYDTYFEDHAQGDKCYVVYNPSIPVTSDVRTFPLINTGVYYAKVIAKIGSEESPIEDTQELTLSSNIAPRYLAPLNCTGLRVNGELWKYNTTKIQVRDDSDIILSWNNKSRLNCSYDSSNGVESIYDETPDFNMLEEDCSYVIEFLSVSNSIIRSVVVPYVSQTPVTANTSLTYTYAQIKADYPDTSNIKVIIKARRLVTAVPEVYVYSRLDRIVDIQTVSFELLNPSVWFLYLRLELNISWSGYRKGFSYKNIFYPEWYGKTYTLLTSFSLSSATEPPEPTSLGVVPSFTTRLIVPSANPTPSFTVADLVAKSWILKTSAIVSGVFKKVNRVYQPTDFFAPYTVIRHISSSVKHIYVASNTDYYSDWFDTHYNYELYITYAWAWVRFTDDTNPDKGVSDPPELPFWNSDIELNKVSRYSPTVVNGGTVPSGRVLAVYARAKAKLTRKSDGAIFWTREYFLKSWKAVLTPDSYSAYRTLKIFPAPTISVVEAVLTNPMRYSYTISVSVDPSATWFSEAWEWRSSMYYTTSATKPIMDLDPNNDSTIPKTSTRIITVTQTNRLRWMVICCDAILYRALETAGTGKAQITPQSYAEFRFFT